MVDHTAKLQEFCTGNQIELIGEYSNVKKTTPIYFKCNQCKIQVKKTFGKLTKYADSPNVSVWAGFCTRCFCLIHR